MSKWACDKEKSDVVVNGACCTHLDVTVLCLGEQEELRVGQLELNPEKEASDGVLCSYSHNSVSSCSWP